MFGHCTREAYKEVRASLVSLNHICSGLIAHMNTSSFFGTSSTSSDRQNEQRRHWAARQVREGHRDEPTAGARREPAAHVQEVPPGVPCVLSSIQCPPAPSLRPRASLRCTSLDSCACSLALIQYSKLTLVANRKCDVCCAAQEDELLSVKHKNGRDELDEHLAYVAHQSASLVALPSKLITACSLNFVTLKQLLHIFSPLLVSQSCFYSLSDSLCACALCSVRALVQAAAPGGRLGARAPQPRRMCFSFSTASVLLSFSCLTTWVSRSVSVATSSRC